MRAGTQTLSACNCRERENSEFEFKLIGEGATRLPKGEKNLIARVARFVAAERGKAIQGARLKVENGIPLARGLGSSSAAIVAGISLYEALSGETLTEDDFFRYALHFEGHGDNLAPARLGGLVVVSVKSGPDGTEDGTTLITLKRKWPERIKIVVVVPALELETKKMRAAIPRKIATSDAIFNVQRAALFQAAISDGRFELLREAMRDRLHQPFRAPLAPPLDKVLELNDCAAEIDGLLGVAISGAGSTVVALFLNNAAEIGRRMQQPFDALGIPSRVLELDIDNDGRRLM